TRSYGDWSSDVCSSDLYRLPSLPPGAYSVTAEIQGFSTETRPDIVLVIDQTAIINFTLKPATVSETVTVTGESPIVDVTRSDVRSEERRVGKEGRERGC